MSKHYLSTNIVQICSGITSGRVLNGELSAQRFQKLFHLHIFTDCFMKISQLLEQIQADVSCMRWPVCLTHARFFNERTSNQT